MNKQKLMELLNNPENLPERAYTTLPSDPTEVIIVVNGETGYYRYQKYSTAELAKETCDYGNEIFGVSEEAREALTIFFYGLSGLCVGIFGAFNAPFPAVESFDVVEINGLSGVDSACGFHSSLLLIIYL